MPGCMQYALHRRSTLRGTVCLVTVSPLRVVDCRVDLLRHPWTLGTGDPAEFEQLISQMDEMMVHDEVVTQKLDAMVRHAHGQHNVWLRGFLSLCRDRSCCGLNACPRDPCALGRHHPVSPHLGSAVARQSTSILHWRMIWTATKFGLTQAMPTTVWMPS